MGPRPIDKSVRGALYFLRRKGKEKPMTNAVRLAATAAALKADRDRDKVQAVQDYADEQRARQANMTRLRGLRLAQERADVNRPGFTGGRLV
jgi:hypothetical protein